MLILIVILFCSALVARILAVFTNIDKEGTIFRQREGETICSHRSTTKNNYDGRPAKTLVVLGSGGHTTEMLHLLSSIEVQNLNSGDTNIYTPLSYIVASTDKTSINRLEAFEQNAANKLKLPKHDAIHTIPRAREVGQSYLTSIFTTIYSILCTAHIVLIKTRPDLILMNGPGTCLPVALWGFILRILSPNITSKSRTKGKIVFIESFCRVKTLSLTGKILWKLRICDLILVHWPELLELEREKNAEQQKLILIDSFIQHNATSDLASRKSISENNALKKDR